MSCSGNLSGRRQIWRALPKHPACRDLQLGPRQISQTDAPDWDQGTPQRWAVHPTVNGMSEDVEDRDSSFSLEDG